MSEEKKESLTNSFIDVGHHELMKLEDSNEVSINADTAILTGLPVNTKLSYKRLYAGNFEITFQGGGKIKLKPAILFLFNDGTFRMYREYNSQMYTRYQRPNYNAKMYARFNFNEGSVVLDDDVVQWHVSCGDRNTTFNGTYDKRFYDLIDGGSIEFYGSCYDCR